MVIELVYLQRQNNNSNACIQQSDELKNKTVRNENYTMNERDTIFLYGIHMYGVQFEEICIFYQYYICNGVRVEYYSYSYGYDILHAARDCNGMCCVKIYK